MTLTPKNFSVDVYSADEIAQAAGVPVARVEALVAGGQVHSLAGERLAILRRTRRSPPSALFAPMAGGVPPFCSISRSSPTRPQRCRSRPRARFTPALRRRSFSSARLGCRKPPKRAMRVDPVSTRLVFIASPGPGGGGGGGGLRQKAPPPRAQRKGKSSLDSPVPVRKAPKPIEAAPTPEPPPPPPEVKPEPLPSSGCASCNGCRKRDRAARRHR